MISPEAIKQNPWDTHTHTLQRPFMISPRPAETVEVRCQSVLLIPQWSILPVSSTDFLKIMGTVTLLKQSLLSFSSLQRQREPDDHMFLFSHVKVRSVCTCLHICVGHFLLQLFGWCDIRRGNVTDGHRLICTPEKGGLFWHNSHSFLKFFQSSLLSRSHES